MIQKLRNGWDIDPSLMSFSLGVVAVHQRHGQTLYPGGQRAHPDPGVLRVLRHDRGVEPEGAGESPSWKGRQVGRWTGADFEAKLTEDRPLPPVQPPNPLGIVWTPEELRRMVGCASNTKNNCSPTRFTPA